MAKAKHGLKNKPSNNPKGRGKQAVTKEQVGIYIDIPVIAKLGGMAEIRKHFEQLIIKLSIK